MEKRAYLTPGAHVDLMAHGRKRLVPFFGADLLSSIDGERVREWLAEMTELVEAGELAPKTVNNARTYLSVAFNVAVRRGLLPRNPCDGVPALPLEQLEIDFLRLAEIEPYLDACADYYQALAEFLIGTGARISEAVRLVGRISISTRGSFGSTDSGPATRTPPGSPRASDFARYRSARAWPKRCGRSDSRLSSEIDDAGWIFLCPRPRRGRYARRTKPYRRTARPFTAGTKRRSKTPRMRDMPLHSLRHTAAAAWLAVATRSSSCSDSSATARLPPPRSTTAISRARL